MRRTKPVPTTHTILFRQRLGRMDSCGPPHVLLLLLRPQPAAAAATAATRDVATPCVTLLQHPLSSKDNASTRSDILAVFFPSQSSCSPRPRFDIDTHETPLQLSVRRCPLSGPTSRSCTGGCVRGTNQGKNAMLPASPRRQGVSSLHPQRCQGFDPTSSAQGVIFMLYTRGDLPEMHRKERSCFGRITAPARPGPARQKAWAAS